MRCRLGRAATGDFGGQVGHPCIPALCRFRQGWQYRVLCRSLRCCLSFCPGLRHPLCRPGFPSARSVPLPAMWGSTGFSAGLVVLPAILPGLVAHALPPWSCGNRIFRRAVGHPCIPALCRFRYEGNTVFFAWACGVACHFARACGTHYAARSCGNRIFRRAVGHPCIPALCRFRYIGQYRFLCLGLWCCLSFCPDLWVSTGYSVLVYVHTLPPGRAAAGYFGGQLDILVSLRCAGSGRGGSTVFSAGDCGAHYAARSCGNRIFRRASWASLYSCAVPVPAGVAVPCSLPGLVAHALPVILPGFMVRALPPWSCGNRAFRRAAGIPVSLRCAGSGTRAVPCSLPEFVVLPVILPGLVGQHWVFSFGLCAHSAARSCDSRTFRRAVGHPCIPALYRFRYEGLYRVLCRRLRHPLCRPGFPSARSVPLPAMWGSTGFSAGLVALPPWSCGNRIFRRAIPCSLPGLVVLPAILPGLAAPIMPPGTVAFFPGKSSLIFRQTRKLYTGSLRNCLPALNRLFFCMSHSLLCDELLHTHLV